MGVSITAVKTFFIARKAGVLFTNTLTLGRQQLFAKVKDIKSTAAAFGEQQAVQSLQFTDEYAEPFIKSLGAAKVDSMDFSAYEGATYIHDLNHQVPVEWHQQFDVVFDGGTLEHVFNFPQAIKNCMQMVKTGGHFMAVTPSNNQMGHGFYQFSPELFFRIFSKENGFEVVHIFITANGGNGPWYEVKDPNEVRSRVTLTNESETDLVIIARRIAAVEIFETIPQQSDYAAIWKHKEENAENIKPTPLINIYQKLVPAFIRSKIWKLRYNLKNRKTYSEGFGRYNPDHFIKREY